jgi:hypothetical protein
MYPKRSFAPGGGYRASLNGYGGGNKKAGIPTNGIGKLALNDRFIKINAYTSTMQRRMVFSTNTLGGVGVGHSQFSNSTTYAHPDGVRRFKPYLFNWKK